MADNSVSQKPMPSASNKVYWQQERLFNNAEDYFRALLADIGNAQDTIVLETFIFRRDTTGTHIITALSQAAARGVHVRLLIDALGSSEYGIEIIQQLHQTSVDARLFHPLPWQKSAQGHTHTSTLSAWLSAELYRLSRINRRTHRKLCVIDQRIAWVGSFNITDDHLGKGQHHWKDLAARVVGGGEVAKLQQSFDQVWHRVNDRARYRKRLRHFFSNHTYKLRREKNNQLINRINQARHRIWITSAYFAPSRHLLRALRQAHKHQVSVRIIVPQKSDMMFFPAISSTYYAFLLRLGIRVYEYQASVLHEKSMLIDDIAIVGSSNLNYRSWRHDLELDLLISHPESIQELEFSYIAALKDCEEITTHRLQSYPITLLVLGWFARLIHYWL